MYSERERKKHMPAVASGLRQGLPFLLVTAFASSSLAPRRRTGRGFQALEKGLFLLKEELFLLIALFMTNPLGYKRWLMNLSESAEKRLVHLLPKEAAGFSVEGYIGTCRGSTPILNPVEQARPDQETFEHSGLTFYLNPEIADRFRSSSMDYDPSLFGKGLSATWPHENGCACHS